MTPTDKLVQEAVRLWNEIAEHDSYNGAITSEQPLKSILESLNYEVEITGYLEQKMKARKRK